MGYDIRTMDLGTKGWAIKKPAAEALVRRHRRDIPSDARIHVTEIHSSRVNEDVSIDFSATKGFVFFAKEIASGVVQTTVAEFNAEMNRRR